jgi:RNA polymerase sigma factor (sigma-70 family)
LLLALQTEAPATRETAWALFEQLYRPVILAWCRRRVPSFEVAEDLTQDVLQKLSLQFLRHSYDPVRGRFRSWLKAVVNNVLTDFARTRQRRPDGDGVGSTEHGRMLADLASPEVADQLSDVIAGQALTKAAQAIAAVQARVQEAHWQAFCLRYGDGLSASEVAAELGLSLANVHKILQRIRNQLEEEMDHG